VRARPVERAEYTQQQQRQQLLALQDPDESARREARQLLVELDHAVRGVWTELGATHGFLAVDEQSVAGLAVAMRRYPLPELVECVRWSARRVADGRLRPAYFATTFRGNAFCARHGEWQAALRAQQRKLEQDAAIAADIAEHRPRAADPLELSGAQLHELGLAALERMAAGSPP
jgi:hypothetical protein